MSAATGTALIGTAVSRVDGRQKVTGAAEYAAELKLAGLLHGVLLGSEIAAGKIRSIDTEAASAAPGVVRVYTYRNCPEIGKLKASFTEGLPGEMHPPLQDEEIRYRGQYVALVIAERLEQAQHAASLIRVEYEPAHSAVRMEDAETTRYQPEQVNGEPLQLKRGNASAALERAPHPFGETYSTPSEHPNPMELHASTARWADGQMTVWDATQWVVGTRGVLADALRLPKEKIRVLAPFVGGMFGSKAATGAHIILTALAARDLGQPIKTVLTREQVMLNVGGRSRTIQRFDLGADADGHLLAMRHQTQSHTSVADEFPEPCGITSRMLYQIPDYETSHDLLRINVMAPAWMRAPGEAPCQFAQEVALDELAYQLGIDPIELRRRNHATVHPQTGKPFSSKHLLECYDRGIERFGWKERNPEPGSMRDGKLLIGQGMATATYPAYTMGATVKVRIAMENGAARAIVSTAAIDVGTGMYTLMSITAADGLGLPLSQITPRLGDTSLPPCAMAGGSNLSSSVAPAIAEACGKLRGKLLQCALEMPHSPLDGLALPDVEFAEGRIQPKGNPGKGVPLAVVLEGAPGAGMEEQGQTSMIMGQNDNFAFQSFGAQFAEVRIDPVLRTVRMSRMLGIFDCGRILNQKAARSQLLGGMTFGIGMALLEEMVFDPAAGKAINADLADYMVPVNADVPPIAVEFVEHPDLQFNPLGVRGVGEIGNTGAAAAIANAVFHATGTRIRDLPILIEKLL